MMTRRRALIEGLRTAGLALTGLALVGGCDNGSNDSAVIKPTAEQQAEQAKRDEETNNAFKKFQAEQKKSRR
jgi:hypothetical protein